MKMKFQNKLKKSALACAVLLSVFSLGTIAEAANVSGDMSADAITENSTISGAMDTLHLISGELNYTLTNNGWFFFDGATKMNAAVNGGNLYFETNGDVGNLSTFVDT